jgi:hypothetical protein
MPPLVAQLGRPFEKIGKVLWRGPGPLPGAYEFGSLQVVFGDCQFTDKMKQ